MQPNYTTQTCTNLSQKLNELPVAQSEYTIYRVYGHLRNINNKAYDPQVIAIGPYHHGKNHLKMMEDHKLHCFHQLLEQKNENVDRYVSAIAPLEKEARKCYVHPISLNVTKFIEMLILDGCFIVQLVRGKLKDPIFHMGWTRFSFRHDLMLFENQVPFFVLCELFNIIEVPNQHIRLMSLLTEFYRPIFPTIANSNRSFHEIKHLLDLIHINLVSSFNPSVLANGTGRFIESATSLKEANVKFKRNEGVSLFDIRFEHGTLYLPPLHIDDDSTESLLRNLIAYEQYFCDIRTSYVTDFVTFFDCLINSPRDVEILSHAGIIENWLGDDRVLADMFNKLTDSVVGCGFIYREIFDKVNEHCNRRSNRWTAKLRRDYLNSPWAIISIIGAIVLLLLTVTQTVCSILQVV